MGAKVKKKTLTGATAEDYVRMQRTLTRIAEYVNLGFYGSLKARNDGIEEGNLIKCHYSQGVIDIFMDMRAILEERQLVIFTEKVQVPPQDPAVG